MSVFQSCEIVTAIELGTSKVCVMVGQLKPEGGVSIIGRGLAESDGSIIKGEIDNREQTGELLSQALLEAERSARQELSRSKVVSILTTGCGIISENRTGTVYIHSEERKVDAESMSEAFDIACVQPPPPGRKSLNQAESAYLIDNRQVHDPLGQTAGHLDAVVHLVYAIPERADNFSSLVADAGFEPACIEPVFSAFASDCGALSDEERELGVLLVDLGMGTTEYVVEFNGGITASGVVQIGFDHVCNDLAIGLELPIKVVRKLFEDGTINEAFRSRRPVVEFKCGGRERHIPLTSLETIIDFRLRELFDIIRSDLAEKGALNGLEAGGVLSGGGALFEHSITLFKECFNMVCRIGTPYLDGSAVSGAEDPRYAAVWGALKLAAECAVERNTASDGMMNKVADLMDGLFSNTRSGLKHLKGAIRI